MKALNPIEYYLPGAEHRSAVVRERMAQMIELMKNGKRVNEMPEIIGTPRITLHKTLKYMREDFGCDTPEQLMYEVGRLEAFRTVHNQR